MDAEQCLDLCLNFPEIHRHLHKSAQEVKVRGLDTMQDMKVLLVELSSKKPHLPMCSVKMEKGDFTSEAGGFWDFYLLAQHRMYRQARGS